MQRYLFHSCLVFLLSQEKGYSRFYWKRLCVYAFMLIDTVPADVGAMQVLLHW